MAHEGSPTLDVADAILRRAQDDPDRPAVADGHETWTYREVSRHARAIGAGLRDTGVRTGDIVVVQGHSSPRTIATLLGVLLAEATYLVVDGELPAGRLAHVFGEASPQVVIADDPGMFSSTGARIVTHDEAGQWHPAGTDNVFATVPRHLPGYVVYTSGTTGLPKGVVISRGSLAWHSSAVRSLFGLSASDRVLQAASFAFDVAAEEIWPTLCAGACVDILHGGLRAMSYAELTRTVRDRGITVVNLPASYFSGWAEYLHQTGQLLPSLRLAVTGSEELPADTARNWCSTGTRPRLINAYGVSEATITSVAFEVRPEAIVDDRVPIGTPLPGVRAVIVDDQGEPVAPGSDGQLLLSGPGIAIGCLGTDPAPAERFPPTATGDAEHGYLTGDRVREENGLLYFLGRTDDQIKVNGVRIDPGEIAAVLAGGSGITDARVMKIGDRIVACVRAHDDIDPESVLLQSGAVLPSVMVPDELVVLAEFPLTAGGKVDMGSLRATVEARLAAGSTAEAQEDLSEILRRLWRETLGTSDIEAHTDFFALGGDSLGAARLSGALRRETGLGCHTRSVFAHPRFDDYLHYLRLLRAGRV